MYILELNEIGKETVWGGNSLLKESRTVLTENVSIAKKRLAKID